MHMKNNFTLGLFLMTSTLLISACDSAESPAATQVNQPNEKSETATGSATLSTRYITGSWCLTETSVMSSVVGNPNVPYIFNNDGTLQYQTSADARINYDGSWKIDGDKLSLMARPLMGSLVVRNLKPDSFVLDFTVQYTFHRGACAK